MGNKNRIEILEERLNIYERQLLQLRCVHFVWHRSYRADNYYEGVPMYYTETCTYCKKQLRKFTTKTDMLIAQKENIEKQLEGEGNGK